jgi:diacylglycerol kinase (ATP)
MRPLTRAGSHGTRRRSNSSLTCTRIRKTVDDSKPDYSTDDNPHKGNRGLVRAWHAAKNSWSGLVFAVQEESAFRQELALAAVLVPAALLLPFGVLERLLLIGSVVLVLIVELLNSSVEAAIDRISFDHHSLSKRAKDIGSAAVFVSLVLLGMVWGVVLLPRYF